MTDNQIPLFPETDVDDVVEMTRRMKDDVAFAKEKRRAQRGKQRTPLPPPPVEGPCCLRCRNWLTPMEGGEYGACRRLGVVEQRVPHLRLEKGHVLAVKDADALRVSVELLRIGAGGACSLFAHLQEAAA